ncbi:MAG: NUDIX domain-containing protein, partial [Bacteroidota bacterium]
MNKKIFIGDKEICFTPKLLKVNSTQKNQLNIFVENKAEMNLVFEFFIRSKKYKSLNLIGASEKIFKSFCSIFKVIEAAGGVISNEKKQILFIYRLKKWDLPKGKIEKGEGKQRAAIRECEEECGIEGLKIIGKLDDSWHMYKLDNEWVLKRT